MISVFGTVYRFHPLFVLLMLLSSLTGYFLELLTLFGVVLIHELGHVAAARSFAWRVKEVQLLPFGGVAVVEESGNVPAREEIVVALAGPLQNAVMIVLALFVQACGWDDGSGWWAYFLEANLAVGLFNLLPVLPLDGGKVAFGLLSYAMSYHRAIVCGTAVSLFLSAALVFGSLLSARSSGLQVNLLAVGLFLLYSNWYAYRHIPYQFIRFLMSRESRAAKRLSRAAIALPIVVPGTATVAEITRLFMREHYHLIYICGERGTIRCVVPEQRLIDVYFTGRQSGSAISDLFM